MSSDGETILVGVNPGRLYLTANGGTSWPEVQPVGTSDSIGVCQT